MPLTSLHQYIHISVVFVAVLLYTGTVPVVSVGLVYTRLLFLREKQVGNCTMPCWVSLTWYKKRFDWKYFKAAKPKKLWGQYKGWFLGGNFFSQSRLYGFQKMQNFMLVSKIYTYLGDKMQKWFQKTTIFWGKLKKSQFIIFLNNFFYVHCVTKVIYIF
jgi:hypothetical protein